jgi:cysteine-rich repeat protein
LPAVCGDGFVEGTEACDDGNADNTDSCVDTCELNACGDGFVHAGVEQCDDGTANSNADPATCRADCTDDDICGDADDSGAVTAVDSLHVLQAAVGLISDCLLTRCDATGDGVITVADSQRILFVAVNLPANLECTLPLSLYVDGAAVYGTLSVEIDYAATGESFLGDGGSVDCSDMSGGGAVVSFDNDAAGEMLTVDLTSVGGIGGPTDLAVCRFRGRDVPDATEFSVIVTDARDVGGQAVAAPVVTVSY